MSNLDDMKNKSIRMAVVLTMATGLLLGCAAQQKTVQKISLPVYPIDFTEPEYVHTAEANKKVLFEGYFTQNDPKLFRIRAVYTRDYPQDRNIKTPFSLAKITILEPTPKGIEKWRAVSWKIGQKEEAMLTTSVKHPYDLNDKHYMGIAAKHYATINRDFFDSAPVQCRSIIDIADIPDSLKTELGIEVKMSAGQKVLGTVAALSMLAGPVGILVSAPLQIGTQAAAQTFGLAAGLGAAQMGLAKAATATPGDSETVALTAGSPEQPVGECFDLGKIKNK